MPTCLHCSARIPAGRNYCHPHYVEALRLHDRNVASYLEALDRWHKLTPTERAARDLDAESDELCVMATLVALVLGGFIWYQAYAWLRIDGLVGLGILLATAMALLFWEPARYLAGKLARASFVMLPPLLGCLGALAVLCLVSGIVRSHALPLFFGIVGLLWIGSLIMEWSGRHHASGMPNYPAEPRP